MTRFEKVIGAVVWIFGGILIVMFLMLCFHALGCSPSATEPKADLCLDRGNAIVDKSATCKDALIRLEQLMKSDPDCAAVVKKNITFVCHDVDVDGGLP